ncbi:glutathione S-transferase family protein [uncultured Neptuniibacter sp.]|uniref:glutathione S-transferase family protein n=1 Tax=uncultured Neptuniibacter sp. TaxID=502143 RepID=UPI00260DF7A5|nr:glutathione S-transferase family protein [uncultured Neptuniibacter sp.]
MSMTLYDKPECPFCWKIRLLLAELDLNTEIMHYHAVGQEAIWQRLTPNRTVPVLTTPDGAIYESDVIVEYLEELTGRLLPKARSERIKARHLNKYSDTKIGAGLREVIFEKRDKPEAKWDQGRINKGIALFNQALPFLEEQLGDNTFFTHDYSLPETALTARFALGERYGVTIPAEFPRLREWFARMKARPSFGLTKPW